MVLYLKSSACCLLSTARGPAHARALHLALGLAFALALDVARALLRALALPFFALRLPFLLATSGHTDLRRSPNRRPGGQHGLLAPGWPQVAAKAAPEPLLAALEAVLERS